jgi:hypothetical protein
MTMFSLRLTRLQSKGLDTPNPICQRSAITVKYNRLRGKPRKNYRLIGSSPTYYKPPFQDYVQTLSHYSPWQPLPHSD